MSDVESKPDFILWLGDNYGHVIHDTEDLPNPNPNPNPNLNPNPNPKTITEDLVLASTRLLAQKVEAYFPGIPVVAAVGNHDTWPVR